MHDRHDRDLREEKTSRARFAGNSDALCETEVLASRGHGSIHLLSKGLVTLVLGEIKFCDKGLAAM